MTGARDNLVEELEINRIFNLLAQYIDQRQGHRFTEICTPDLKFAGPDGETVGVDALIGRAQMLADKFEGLHHAIMGTVVEFDGNRASARTNLIATHVFRADRPDQHFDVGAVYEAQLERADATAPWKFATLRVVPCWINGTFEPH